MYASVVAFHSKMACSSAGLFARFAASACLCLVLLSPAAGYDSTPSNPVQLRKLNTVIRMVNEFMRHGKLREAQSILERNLDCCFPDNFSLLEQLGLALHHRGHQEEAIVKYKRALRLHPEHSGVAGLLSNLALSQEEADDVTEGGWGG